MQHSFIIILISFVFLAITLTLNLVDLVLSSLLPFRWGVHLFSLVFYYKSSLCIYFDFILLFCFYLLQILLYNFIILLSFYCVPNFLIFVFNYFVLFCSSSLFFSDKGKQSQTFPHEYRFPWVCRLWCDVFFHCCFSQFGRLWQIYHRMGGLNHKHLFSQLWMLGSRRSTYLVSLLPDLQRAAYSLYSNLVESRQRASKLFHVSSYEGTNRIYEGSTSTT